MFDTHDLEQDTLYVSRGGGGVLITLTKDTAQSDRVEGFHRAPLAAQLWANANLGDNPHPPCQHSLFEETGENPRISVER